MIKLLLAALLLLYPLAHVLASAPEARGMKEKMDRNLGLHAKAGYAFMSVDNSASSYFEDFAGFAFGASIDYKINDDYLAGFSANIAFAPFVRNFRLSLENKELKGPANLRTNFYGLSLYRRLSNANGFFISLGPALSLNHIEFKRLDKNETGVEKKNKIMLENLGLRASLKKDRLKGARFWELSVYYLKRDTFYLVNNTSIDARKLKKKRERNGKINFAVLLDFGFHVF